MEEKYEFHTTKLQYVFSLIVRHTETSFFLLIAIVISSEVLSALSSEEKATSEVSYLYVLYFILAIAIMFITTLMVTWVKLSASNAKLPSLIIGPSGVTLNKFGDETVFSWDEVTEVTVVGKFKKSIRLNKDECATLYLFDYYLFLPEQRMTILSLLRSQLKEG